MVIVFLLGLLVVNGLVFGMISGHVAESKGYDDGFLWGFFLGILGLIVVGLRERKETIGEADSNSEKHCIESIKVLNELRKEGAITDEVFQQKIDSIVNQASVNEECDDVFDQDKEKVIPIKLGASGYRCPKCRKAQSSSESRCIACHVKFEI